MAVYRFLASLPAILGVAGFFAYLWAGQYRIGGDLLKKIVDKLRQDPNLGIEKYGALTPTKLQSLVASDERVRHAVNEGDSDLLRLLIIFQYALTALVLLVCATLIGLSVWLYTRPEPFTLEQTGVKAVMSAADGLLVDLDSVRVDWTFGGPDETVNVFLENVDTRQRTQKKTIPASARGVQFDPLDLSPILTVRAYRGKNRIRSIVEWRGGTSVSEPQDLLVGIAVELQLFGRLVSPDGTTRTIHTLFATIDRSTENMPRDYRFKGNFVARTTTGPLVVPLISNNAEGEVQIPALEQVDWAGPIGFVYDGPDDMKLVRSQVMGRGPSTVTSARK